MQYVRPVDFGAFNADEFQSQVLADRSSGLDSAICIVSRVPPGKGSLSGPHIHPADQFYFVLQGQMEMQIGNRRLSAGPNQLVYFPAGVPHMNWNDGSEAELHFAWITPQPLPGEDLVTPVDAAACAASDTSGLNLVRNLADAQFTTRDSWSQVVMADRSSGVDSLSMGVFRVPPGVRLPSLHVHRFDQIYYVVRGSMRVQIGLEEYDAGPNTLVVLPAGMPHTNWNDGNEPEYHLNLRVPEPMDPNTHNWDIPVRFSAL